MTAQSNVQKLASWLDDVVVAEPQYRSQSIPFPRLYKGGTDILVESWGGDEVKPQTYPEEVRNEGNPVVCDGSFGS